MLAGITGGKWRMREVLAFMNTGSSCHIPFYIVYALQGIKQL